jgi:hypothetical protein
VDGDAMTDTLTTNPPAPTTTDAVDRLLAGIVAGAIPAGVYAPDAALDATVPGWRFAVTGEQEILEEYAAWFAEPGRFEEIRRLPCEGGAVVEYLLAWEEDGEPRAAHHAHLLTVVGDRITSDHVFCGGRWGPHFLGRMAAATDGG